MVAHVAERREHTRKPLLMLPRNVVIEKRLTHHGERRADLPYRNPEIVHSIGTAAGSPLHLLRSLPDPIVQEIDACFAIRCSPRMRRVCNNLARKDTTATSRATDRTSQ